MVEAGSPLADEFMAPRSPPLYFLLFYTRRTGIWAWSQRSSISFASDSLKKISLFEVSNRCYDIQKLFSVIRDGSSNIMYKISYKQCEKNTQNSTVGEEPVNTAAIPSDITDPSARWPQISFSEPDRQWQKTTPCMSFSLPHIAPNLPQVPSLPAIVHSTFGLCRIHTRGENKGVYAARRLSAKSASEHSLYTAQCTMVMPVDGSRI